MVSTVHNGTETIKRNRRRPRQNQTNKNHIEKIWGENAKTEIKIPSVIDDYNHWMLGVDKSDQLIAYYRPVLRVRRYWMALMFHGLDILRINMYIIHLQLLDDANQLDHKTFLCEFISALLGRAAAFKYGKTRTAIMKANKGVGKFRKRQRMSASAPSLPKAHLLGKKEDHTVTIDKNSVQ